MLLSLRCYQSRPWPDFTKHEEAPYIELSLLISRKLLDYLSPHLPLKTNDTAELKASSWTDHRQVEGSMKYPLSRDQLGRYNQR